MRVDRDSLIYMAGIVDGEGHIGLHYQNTTNQFKPVIGVTNTDVRLVDWIQGLWSGSVDVRQYYDSRQGFGNLKPRIQWRLVGGKAIDLIALIRPYLKLKGEQADLVIAFWDLHEEFDIHSGITAPQEYIDIAEGMHEEMAKLNHRGRKEE